MKRFKQTTPGHRSQPLLAHYQGLASLKLVAAFSLTALLVSSCNKEAITPPAPQVEAVVIDKDITTRTVLEDRIASPDLPDYIVTKSIAVKAELTANPGVVIAFEQDVRFDINKDGGVLIAKGTADKKIRFRGVNPTKGYWRGIMLYSNSNANELEHAEILHTGSSILYDGKKAGIALFKESQIAVKNTSISQNNGYGLFVQEEATLREFSMNTFSNNTDAGIQLPTTEVEKLDAASVFTSNNGRNVVEVIGAYLGNNTSRTTPIVWAGFSDKTPYRLLNTVTARKTWKLGPGVTIEMARDAAILVDPEGELIAQGTTTQKIKFTSETGATAYWRGILCHSSSSQSLIEQAEILNAGSVNLLSSRKAALATYGNGAKLTVKNTRISGSGGYGIIVGYRTTINADVATANTFDGNAQAAVLVED